MVEKINQIKTWFFEKKNKIYKHLAYTVKWAGGREFYEQSDTYKFGNLDEMDQLLEDYKHTKLSQE